MVKRNIVLTNLVSNSSTTYAFYDRQWLTVGMFFAWRHYTLGFLVGVLVFIRLCLIFPCIVAFFIIIDPRSIHLSSPFTVTFSLSSRCSISLSAVYRHFYHSTFYFLFYHFSQYFCIVFPLFLLHISLSSS